MMFVCVAMFECACNRTDHTGTRATDSSETRSSREAGYQAGFKMGQDHARIGGGMPKDVFFETIPGIQLKAVDPKPANPNDWMDAWRLGFKDGLRRSQK